MPTPVFYKSVIQNNTNHWEDIRNDVLILMELFLNLKSKKMAIHVIHISNNMHKAIKCLEWFPVCDGEMC